jgi:hypothetical protein
MKANRILNVCHCFLLAGSLLVAGPLQAQFALSQGCLYVYQIGDGTNNLISAGATVFIDQFSTNGTLLNQVALPDSGTNAFIASGSSGSEGSLSLSPVGNALIFGGYNTNLNLTFTGTGMNGRPAIGNNRDVGAVSVNGAFSIVAVSTNFFGPSAGAPRGAVTDGNGNYWVAGSGSGGSDATDTTNGLGVDYYGNNAAPAQVAGTGLLSTPRSIQIYGNTLYFTGGTLLESLPETNAENGPVTPAIVINDGASPEGFVFNTNITTCYIAESTISPGGIERYDLLDRSWTLSYTFSSGSAFAFVTANFNGGGTGTNLVYVTTLPINGSTAGGNLLEEFVDSGPESASQSPVVLAAAPSSSTSPDGAGINYNGIVYDSIAASLPSTPLVLTFPQALGGDSFKFSWTNTPSLHFTVYAATNLTIPLNQWTLLGVATDSPSGSGHYEFTDPQATTAASFYYVHWP